jgi:hypothetical protein
MQLITSLLILLISIVNQEPEKSLYLFYSDDNFHEKRLKPANCFDYFFKINHLSIEYEQFVEELIFESISDPISIKNPTEMKNINWLRKEYIKAFENFKNKPIGVDRNGKVLHFDLMKNYSKIYIIEKVDGEYRSTEVRPVSIIE